MINVEYKLIENGTKYPLMDQESQGGGKSIKACLLLALLLFNYLYNYGIEHVKNMKLNICNFVQINSVHKLRESVTFGFLLLVVLYSASYVCTCLYILCKYFVGIHFIFILCFF